LYGWNRWLERATATQQEIKSLAALFLYVTPRGVSPGYLESLKKAQKRYKDLVEEASSPDISPKN
jgi:hypothetical protein